MLWADRLYHAGMPAFVSRRAHAKLNLALAVGPPVAGEGPRAGWHRIASWMHAIDLTDEVTIERTAEDDNSEHRVSVVWAADAPHRRSESDTPVEWPIESDLASKALAAMEQRLERTLPVSITIRKRIPAAGGLAGGTADAAAVLLGVNELFEFGLPIEALRECADSVGSDLHFFLDDATGPADPPRPALVTGFGDQIERIARSAGEIVLILSELACETPAIYAAYDRLDQPRHERSFDSAAIVNARDPRDELCMNDLQRAAEHAEPRLAEIRERVEAAVGKGRAHLTGSGSTMFVLTRDVRATDLIDRLRRALADAPVAATPIATRLA